MTTVIAMSKRGTATLPPALRRKLGMDWMDHPLVICEERDGEVAITP